MKISGVDVGLSITAHGVEVAGSAAEVVIERLRHFEDAFDVFHGKGGSLVDRQGLGGADGVFDLGSRLLDGV